MGSARILRAYRHIPVAVFFPLPFQKGEDEGEGFFFSVAWSGRTIFQFLTFLFSSHLSCPQWRFASGPPEGESEGEETLVASDVKRSRQISANAHATGYSSSTTGLGRGDETVTCVILSSGARRASNTTD